MQEGSVIGLYLGVGIRVRYQEFRVINQKLREIIQEFKKERPGNQEVTR